MNKRILKIVLLTAYLLSGVLAFGQIKTWSRSGNVISDTEFVGSTNNYPLKFKTNNRIIEKIDSLGNIIFFKKAGTSNYDTLFSIRKDGLINAGGSISYGSISMGRNTGFDSGLVHNTFFGYDCAGTNGEDPRLTKSLTTGYRNTGFGAIVMRRLTTGSFNTAVGDESMEFLEDAQYNTAVGRFGQNANKSSNNNTSLGYGCLAGQFRTVAGNLQPCNTFPNNTIAIGFNTLNQDTVATDNNCMGGYLTGQYLIGGSDNTAWGSNIMSLGATTPMRNSIFGEFAGQNITSATDNDLFGYQAGNILTTGSKNVFLSRSAGQNITGNENVCIGYLSAQLFTGAVAANGMINIGAYSGRYDARTNVGHIGNQDNGSVALDTTNSISVFYMDANPLNQRWKFNSKLHIVDGTQGNGKVFTSDANGIGSWQTLTVTPTQTVTLTGDVVGTGTASIATKLTGNITINGTTSSYSTNPTFTISSGTTYTNTAPITINSSTIGLQYGTGLSVSSGSLITSSIPNSALSNSTISGAALGTNLSNLINGYGVLGGSYNGSGAITLRVDSTHLVDKLFLAAQLAGYASSGATFTVNGTGMALGTSSTITAAAGTLTGSTLNSTVVNSSLTSAGTFTTGTWQAGVVAGQYGGTGVANTGKTITIGANLTTTGTGAPTLAFPATTSYTYTYPSVSTTVVGRTGNMAANRIAFMSDANQIATQANFQYKVFDPGNSGRAVYIGDTATNNFVLGNYGLTTNTTILNCPTASGDINMRFQNGANQFNIHSASSVYNAYIACNTMIGNTTTSNAKLAISGNTALAYTNTGSGLALQSFTITDPGVSSTYTGNIAIHDVAASTIGGANTHTVTNMATFQIEGATNTTGTITITNNAALRVVSGITDLEGKTGVGVPSPTYSLDVNGDIGLPNLGNTIRLKTVSTSTTSSTQMAGKSTLTAGTVTITNANVTANSLIYVTDTNSGSLTNVGSLNVVAGSGSFTVTSTNILDTSTFNYFIIQPY